MSFLDVGRGSGGGSGSSSGFSSNPFGDQEESVEARELQKLQSNVQSFARRVAEIDNYVKMIGTARDNHGLRARVRNGVDEVQLQMKQIMADVKRISQMDMTGPEKKKYSVQRQKLIQEFTNTGTDFKKVAAIAAQREKTPIPEAVAKKAQAGADLDDTERQGLLEAERREQAEQMEAQRAYIDGVNLQREEEVRQLEESVVQVNEMFHDLAQLVTEQGVLIDTIEANVVDAKEDVEEGEKQIDKAMDYQKKGRSKMCCILVFVIVIFLVLVAVAVAGVLLHVYGIF